MAKRITVCECCKGYQKSFNIGRATSFVVGNVRHYVPDAWLMGAFSGFGKDAQATAFTRWSEQCEMRAAA